MISWHKPGQKVAVVGNGWHLSLLPFIRMAGPAEGEVCTIRRVIHSWRRISFELVEWPGRYMNARRFRPVYPTIIDQLREFDAPVPELERVKEDA